MTTTKRALVLLLVFTAVCARHHKHEHEQTSDVTSDDTQPQEDKAELDTKKQRRKRWYNGYAYQPPSYRDDGMHGPPSAPLGPANYDPFAYIYRRLDELTAVFRQPIPPPTPILVPYPVYINPATCGCQPAQPGQQPVGTPQPPEEPMPNITIPNRFNTDDDDYDDIPLRPLSFDPVKPDRPLTRPVPAVEHGSAQGGASVPTGREPPSQPALVSAGFAANAPTSTPSRCDIATLTCCHQRYTTNQCFNSFGCASVLRNSNPCDARTISNVVSVFQNFYRNN